MSIIDLKILLFVQENKGITNNFDEIAKDASNLFSFNEILNFIFELCRDIEMHTMTSIEIQKFDNQLPFHVAQVKDDITGKMQEKIAIQSYMASLYGQLCDKYDLACKYDEKLANELKIRMNRIFNK